MSILIDREVIHQLQEHDGEFVQCEICGGPVGLLGVLGNTTWGRCRNCGAEFSFCDQAVS